MKPDIHPTTAKRRQMLVRQHLHDPVHEVSDDRRTVQRMHPFFTGKQKLVDTGGRVERFQRRYAQKTKARAPKA